jgi:hypothetical protein
MNLTQGCGNKGTLHQQRGAIAMSVPWVAYAFPLVFVTFGVALLVKAVAFWRESRACSKWPTVPGHDGGDHVLPIARLEHRLRRMLRVVVDRHFGARAILGGERLCRAPATSQDRVAHVAACAGVLVMIGFGFFGFIILAAGLLRT